MRDYTTNALWPRELSKKEVIRSRPSMRLPPNGVYGKFGRIQEVDMKRNFVPDVTLGSGKVRNTTGLRGRNEVFANARVSLEIG